MAHPLLEDNIFKPDSTSSGPPDIQLHDQWLTE